VTQIDQLLGHSQTGPFASVPVWETRLVELNRQFGLLTLAVQVRQNGFENRDTFPGPHMRHVQEAMFDRIFQVPGCVVLQAQAKEVAHRSNGARISHLKAEAESIGRRSASLKGRYALNCDTSFAVDEAREVGQLHRIIHCGTSLRATLYEGSTEVKSLRSLYKKNPAKSGDTLPGDAEGNPEPSSLSDQAGVCREQGPDSKEMVCSDLHGNMQRAAEMTVPFPCKEYGWEE
jgi:hypothetical protein